MVRKIALEEHFLSPDSKNIGCPPWPASIRKW